MTIETKMTARSGRTSTREFTREMMTAFDALKAANDARLDKIERHGSADPLIDAKLARIARALSEQKSALDRLARPARTDGAGGLVDRQGARLLRDP